MKGLILSGGRGTRLRPITHTSAKQLVPVANRPILFYAIEALRDAGITDVGIVVGDSGDEIRAAVGDGSGFGVRVTYLQQEAPLGLAHAVSIAREFMDGDRFVVYLGDNLIADGITGYVDSFRGSSAEAMILLARVPEPQRFGVAELEGDRVVRLVEKPEHPPSDLALVGVYMFSARIFEAIDTIVPSARGELEITDAIQWLLDQGHEIAHEILQGWWIDTGKKDPLLHCNRLVLDTIAARIDGTVDEPAEIDAYGPRALSPSTTSTRSSGILSSSAAICAIAVRVPVPMSCIAVTTVTRPSEPTRIHAYDGGPPPPYQICDARPTPRFQLPSERLRNSSRRAQCSSARR